MLLYPHLKTLDKPITLALGNFDGVHLGHQALIDQLCTIAQMHKLQPVVLTFEPQPKEVLLRADAPPRLTLFRDKMRLLAQRPVTIFCLNFRRIGRLEPEVFVQLLEQYFSIKAIVVGADIRFGYGGKGDLALLQRLGQRRGFEVVAVNKVVYQDQIISSSLIRSYLRQGRMTEANALLGHAYQLSGRVRYGQQRGRLLGFPTLNIRLKYNSPLRGVYAVRVHLRQQEYAGVANIGHRPTLNEKGVLLLEIHLFDFNDYCYGEDISITFIAKLRDEQKFADLEALKAQIQADVMQAKLLLAVKS